MTNEDYTRSVLDTIDLEPYLKGAKNDTRAYDIMQAIGDDNDEGFKDNPVFQGSLFNCLNEDEFIDYIRRRYGGKYDFYEKETWCFYRRKYL